jgi:7,8-dihydropterin-6-yl-methyl-4-(beta-D-ribofuranosyl)aminobenzene 5'-phosphate synthase
MTDSSQIVSRRGYATVGVVLLIASMAGALANLDAQGRTSEEQSDPLKITVLYDNYLVDQRLEADWGYAAIVEFRSRTVLFDTGADGATLLGNMKALGFDPGQIEAVVLSHAHGDHTNGLDSLLAAGARPAVYLLPSFPADFKRHIAEIVDVVEVEPGQAIAAGLFTTGEIIGPVNEQALVVESSAGLVILTGCAHPGIVEIISRVKTLSDKNVHLVTGGFHLLQASADQVRSIVADFRRLGVERTAPSHCTGDAAIEMFREEYGDDFVRSGAGCVFQIPS